MNRDLKTCAISTFAGALLFAGSTSTCILVLDEPEYCGGNARRVGSNCRCHPGYQGDPYDYCEPVESVQTWWVTDGCDDGSSLSWQLYSRSRSWQWPQGDLSYQTPRFGLASAESILCNTGETVCFGAWTEVLEWGCGIDGTAPNCDDWCYRCEELDVDIGYLSCP